MPKLVVNLTAEQKQVLQDNGLDIAQFLKDVLKTKLENMVWVSERELDNIPGRVKNKVESISDIPDSHTEKLKNLKTQGKLDFIDFAKGKFNQKAKDIVKVELEANSVSVTITPKQEAFLFCDMVDPEEWINNAIQVYANKLLARIK